MEQARIEWLTWLRRAMRRIPGSGLGHRQRELHLHRAAHLSRRRRGAHVRRRAGPVEHRNALRALDRTRREYAEGSAKLVWIDQRRSARRRCPTGWRHWSHKARRAPDNESHRHRRRSGLEQWRTFRWRGALQQLVHPIRARLEHRFNGGIDAARRARGVARDRSAGCSSSPAGYWALDRCIRCSASSGTSLILYLLIGFRHFSHAFSAIVDALRSGRCDRRARAPRGVARRDASAVTAEEIPKLAIEQGLDDSYRHVFGILFWFLVLPGPVARCCTALTVLLAARVAGRRGDAVGHQLAPFGRPVQRLLYWLDWIPVRLTALDLRRRRRLRGRGLLLAHAGRAMAVA